MMAFRCPPDRLVHEAGGLPGRSGDRLSWAKSRPVQRVSRACIYLISTRVEETALSLPFFGGPGGIFPRFT